MANWQIEQIVVGIKEIIAIHKNEEGDTDA